MTRPATGAHDTTTLYERIGGAEGVAKLIDRFYERVVAEPDLAHFFQHADIAKLRSMQREFFGAALDGPQAYSGLSLAQAHAGRGITGRHFSAYVRCLLDTLADLGLPQKDIQDVVDRIATYVDDITVTGPNAG